MQENQLIVLTEESQTLLQDNHARIAQVTEYTSRQRELMRQIDLAYLREQDATSENLRGRSANTAGDADRFQNIVVPIVKPQIGAAVDYQIGVFLSEYPLLQTVSDPQYIDIAKQMQALIEENSVRTGWAAQLSNFFFDAYKYTGILHVEWCQRTIAGVETNVAYKESKEGKPRKVTWQGNKLERWDPYNTYYDTLVPHADLPTQGAFAGTTVLMSRIGLKTFIQNLRSGIRANISAAMESPYTGDSRSAAVSTYYDPNLRPIAAGAGKHDLAGWLQWMGALDVRHSNKSGLYEVSTEYVRIIPDDFKMRVPSRNTAQIWKCIWVNHKVLLVCEPVNNAHEMIPAFAFKFSEEGLGHHSKSLAEDGMPFQSVASALMNGVVHGRRRAVSDRLIYDPSRILEAHINNPSPVAKIPVRPSAYGKPVADAVHLLGYRDDQAGVALNEIGQVVSLSERLNGLNSVRQGQFVKGNKTDTQWQDTMSGATSRDQRAALLFQSGPLTQIKEVIKLNILQYAQVTTVFSHSLQREVEVDPVQLRQAVLNFKLTDGLLPKDRVVPSDVMQAGLSAISQSPQLAAHYNIAPAFSYLMKLNNADLEAFQKSPAQVAYEQALEAWRNAAMEAAKKGLQLSTPMPLPQQFGYNPGADPNSPQQQAPQA